MRGRKPELKKLQSSLRVANGEAMKPLGSCTFSASKGGQRYRIRMIVADLKGVQEILGMDFLTGNKAEMDLAKGVLHLHGRAVQMVKEPTS